MKTNKYEIDLKETIKDFNIFKKTTEQLEIEKLLQKYQSQEEETEKWRHKYQSQVAKMGAYKQKVAKEVREREKELKYIEDRIDDKKRFLERNNYEDFETKQKKIDKLKEEIEQKNIEFRKSLLNNFEKATDNIINELSKELIRWTEENDIDNARSQGYLIGINKAKKIIREKMTFELNEYRKQNVRML